MPRVPPPYKENAMAISPSSIYDINRDMYFDTHASQAQYERDMYFRRKCDEEYRRLQNAYPPGQDAQFKYALAQAPKPDPKDPLSFLSKADSKLLLTGATS
jgi:hypothetical protein